MKFWQAFRDVYGGLLLTLALVAVSIGLANWLWDGVREWIKGVWR